MTPENAIATLHRQAQTAKRVAALRQRRSALGLTRMEVYVHPDDRAKVRAYVRQLSEQRA